MGSKRMVTAGLERVVRSEDMAVMGITEVVRHLPRIFAEYRKLKRAAQRAQPDIAILIDFPDIHFKLAEEFHSRGVPVIFFVSPQLWAWKKHRIQLVPRFVTRMLVIFPFEEAFYREHGVEAEFVGHPLAELPPPSISREDFADANKLDPARTWIALLPGSRPKEIEDILPELLEAAWQLTEREDKDKREYEFLVPLAPTLNAEQRQHVLAIVDEKACGVDIRLVDDARAALRHSRAAVVASGTATVEAALIGNPFVVVYRVSQLTYAIARRVVTVPHVAMANLIAAKRVVPELIQGDFTAANIVQQIELLLPDGPVRQSMMEELLKIRELLRTTHTATHAAPGAIERVAAITLEEIQAASQARIRTRIEESVEV
jgi:lipid-A-disaccharide synthase